MPTSSNLKSKINLSQLIPPKPIPTRGRPFPLSSTAEWFIYPHGKVVYLYNLIDSINTKEYRDHAYPVTVAKVSPSKTFVASADSSGTLKVWNLTDFSTKLDSRVLAGGINDLTWSENEQLIAVVGEGRETFGNVIKVDGGASFGEIVGPTKSSSALSLSPSASHLIIGSDDKSVTIFAAQPKFKFVKSIRDHENFVQVVRFSPNGELFATAGADGNIFIYSASTFEKIGGGKWHEAGVTAMEWISNEILCTASVDKSVKLRRVSDGSLINSTTRKQESESLSFEKQISGITSFGTSKNETGLFVLRLDGTVENLSIDQSVKDIKVTGNLPLGHGKGIVDLMKRSDGPESEFISLSYDGNGINWSLTANSANITKQKQFKFNANVRKLSNFTTAISEDKIIKVDLEDSSQNDKHEKFPDKIVESFENYLFLLMNGILQVVGRGEEASPDSIALPVLSSISNDQIDAAAFSVDGKKLAIATADRLNMYEITDGPNGTITVSLMTSVAEATNGMISAIAFNESNTRIATGDDQRRVKIYNLSTSNGLQREKTQWCNHSARIDTISWLDAETIATSGVDGDILLWNGSVNKIGPISTIKSAHSAPITKIIKLTEDRIISAGSDSCLRLWSWSQ